MKELNESRPEVGSSIMKTWGSLISCKANATLLRYPPEIPGTVKLKNSPPIKVSKIFYNFKS